MAARQHSCFAQLKHVSTVLAIYNRRWQLRSGGERVTSAGVQRRRAAAKDWPGGTNAHARIYGRSVDGAASAWDLVALCSCSGRTRFSRPLRKRQLLLALRRPRSALLGSPCLAAHRDRTWQDPLQAAVLPSAGPWPAGQRRPLAWGTSCTPATPQKMPLPAHTAPALKRHTNESLMASGPPCVLTCCSLGAV